MKEFKKWLKENSIKTGLLYDKQKEEQREIGWRAALELVDGMLWLACGQVVNEVKERIKEELREEG